MNIRSTIVSKPGGALLALAAIGALYARRRTGASKEPEPEDREAESESEPVGEI